MIIVFDTDETIAKMVETDLNNIQFDGVKIDFVSSGRKSSMSFESTDFVSIGITIVTSIGLNVISSYLYDLLKQHGHKLKLKIGGNYLTPKSHHEIQQSLLEERHSKHMEDVGDK